MHDEASKNRAGRESGGRTHWRNIEDGEEEEEGWGSSGAVRKERKEGVQEYHGKS